MMSCPRCQRSFDDGVRFCPADGSLVTAAVEDRNLGRVLLGQFELREVCGRGAMGTVYVAYQRSMDRVVAVKILRRELLKEPEVVRRFLREARAAAKLQHPNIVTVHMVGETDDGLPFLVMEHIDGVSLEAICEAQGPQPIARVLSLGRQIAIALAEAHHAGIVHRDLKPANILVTDRSRVPDQVKVLDFGIAKIVNNIESDQSIVTRDGVIFGTPHYIAPEQATGAEIDHRADLYSLGVILFRLSTGRLPFEGSAGMQVVLKHLRDAPPKPRDLEPQLPQSLEKLILDCLAKDRALRPADAEAIIQALDRVSSQPASATMFGMPQPVQPATPARAAQSKPAPAKASVVAVASTPAPPRAQPRPAPIAPRAPQAPVAGVVVTGRMRRPLAIEAERDEEPPRRSRGRRGVYVGALVAVAVGAFAGVTAALLHNRVDVPAQVVAPPPPEQKFVTPIPPPSTKLEEEHALEEDGFTLLAGFEQKPLADSPAAIQVRLASGAGPVTGAQIEIVVQPPAGAEQMVLAPSTEIGGRYRGVFDWRASGKYKLRVLASLPGRSGNAPLELAYDVDARAAQAATPPARLGREPRHPREPGGTDELPITVVPADPVAPVGPRRLQGGSAPPREVPATPAPVIAPPSTTVILPPPATTTTTVIEPAPAPPPRRAPKPRPAPSAEDPPASEPPPSADPTTLPPPAPDEPR